jgi:hypothetical protein
MFEQKQSTQIAGILLAAGLLSFTLLSQAQEPPKLPAKLQASAGDKAQPGTPTAQAGGETMPGSQSEPGASPRTIAATQVRPTLPLPSQVQSMEERLRVAVPAVPGDLPSVDRIPADTSRGGGQLNPLLVRAARTAETHLSVVLRVRDDGTSEVVSATELPGPPAVSTEPRGDFLYAVADGGRTVAVEALSDPFEAHAFGGPPGTPQEKHFFVRQKEATIVVQIPASKLESPLTGLSFELYQLKAGPALEKVDAEVLQGLQRDQRLRSLVQTKGIELAPQIRQKGLVLQPEELQVPQ